MSVTARPTDSHFSVMEQQAMLRWKELRDAAVESEDQKYSPSARVAVTSSTDRSNTLDSTLRTPREQKYPSGNKYTSNTMIRPDNPLSIEEKLAKLAEPTLCWCKQEASVLNTTVFGIIYECHKLRAFREFQSPESSECGLEDQRSSANEISDPQQETSNQSNHSSPAPNSPSNNHQMAALKSKNIPNDNSLRSQSDAEKTKGRTLPSNICGFHVHKRTWDQLRSQLQNGVDLDPKHPELNICPAFNLTFCATFRLANHYPKRSPPVPRCFCNFPVKLLMSHGGIHKNRVTFTCPNFDVDNARPKCSWALAAEEVPFIPSLFCSHEVDAKQSIVNGISDPPGSAQKKASQNLPVYSEQREITHNEPSNPDITNVTSPEISNDQIDQDLCHNNEAVNGSMNNTNEVADRQGIRWTKERHALSAQKNAISPVVNGGVTDSMAGPSFSTYSTDVEETEEGLPHNLISEPPSRGFHTTDYKQLPNDVYPNSSSYRRTAPMANDITRQHQISLWKTMLHNKTENNVSDWMTGLDITNDGGSQHVPVYRGTSVEGPGWNYNGDRYYDNAPFPSYQSPTVDSIDYGMHTYSSSVNGQIFYDNQALRSQAANRQRNRIMPSSVYKSLITSNQASKNASKANPEIIPPEVPNLDVQSVTEASNTALPSSSSSPTRSKQLPKQYTRESPNLMTTPPFVQRNVKEVEQEDDMASGNSVNRNLDALEANFHKSVSVLFLNQKRQLQQLQEQLATNSEESYALYNHIAKLENSQKELIVENELFKREKLHIEQSFDKIQQLHTEEVELRRSCQRRTANLEIVIAEIIEQNERLQQELDEKNEVAKMSDFKCRVCWHNTITHATIPCYHCVYCEGCADKVKECAMCRQEKEGTQRIYLG